MGALHMTLKHNLTEDVVILTMASTMALAYWACAVIDSDAGRHESAATNVIMVIINLIVVNVFMRFVGHDLAIRDWNKRMEKYQ